MENQNKYEQKNLTGTLWMDLQTKTGTNGAYQCYSGSMLIDGKEYWLTGYPRETKSGKHLISLTLKLKQPKPEAPRDEFAAEPMPVMNGLAQFVDEKPQAAEIPLADIPF